MNASIDAALINMIQQHVCKLSSDVEKMTFENQEFEERINNLQEIQENIQLFLQEIQTLMKTMEEKHVQQHEVVQQLVRKLEEQKVYSISLEKSLSNGKLYKLL